MTPDETIIDVIERRASEPSTRDRCMAKMGDRSLSYRDFRNQSIHWAQVFAGHCAPVSGQGRVAVLMHNNLEYLLACAGAAYAGVLVFLLNTSVSTKSLSSVLEHSRADLVVVDQANQDKLKRAINGLSSKPVVLNLSAMDPSGSLTQSPVDPVFDAPGSETPWLVMYTSGTTGTPKGVISSHGKVLGITRSVGKLIGLRPTDVGYICTPLFHSNALWLNWIPSILHGGSVEIRTRFSASDFCRDVFDHGVTFWNYVGQPVHYVLQAIEKSAIDGGVEAAFRKVREHPNNKMRLALGTGASGRDRQRLKDCFGLEHVYEAYGSTEGEIITWLKPGDPIDSVGEVTDDAVFIADEEGRPCPELALGECGRPTNQQSAVGEIVRQGISGNFQGYYNMEEESQRKFRDGIYHSGDLGAIRSESSRRYLYFFGRTNDWIRKNGENLCAESVVDGVRTFPAIDLTVAYGVPHPIADEWIMIAISVKSGWEFEWDQFSRHCERLTEEIGNALLVPDFVRLVDDFEWTATHKIRLDSLRADYYHPGRAERVFHRPGRGRRFEPFSLEDYERVCAQFAEAGREASLPATQS